MDDSQSKIKILAVDDNDEGLFVLEQTLLSDGYEVVTAQSGRETLEKAESELPDVILLDVMMPEPNGFEVARILRGHETLRYTPIVLLTGRNEQDDIVFGLEQGADDYIIKPFEKGELLARLKAILRTRTLYRDLQASHNAQKQLQSRVESQYTFSKIVGKSAPMQQVFSFATKVMDSDVPVLITGESGTGKELIASALHFNSVRKDRPFVVQNCSAFNESLLESELFGHVRGAFTGAVRDKQGLFEAADGGTFFLDELGEMSAPLQAKLLRVLQDGTFTPVGGIKPKRVSVRVVAATHRNLEEMISQGKFREDLFYRLNVVPLRMPPLRERQGDIPLLAQYFLDKFSGSSGNKRLTQRALAALERYHWPGNIRQLENEIQRAVLLCSDKPEIDLEDLSTNVRVGAVAPAKSKADTPTPENQADLKEAIERLEKTMIEEALAKTGGNKSEAARQLGISRSSLITKAAEYGLDNSGEQ